MKTERMYREDRTRLGINSQLDHFLDTPHPLPEREAIARAHHVETRTLEYLMESCDSRDPRNALWARLTLTLVMCGSWKRTRRV